VGRRLLHLFAYGVPPLTVSTRRSGFWGGLIRFDNFSQLGALRYLSELIVRGMVRNGVFIGSTLDSGRRFIFRREI
jgi:hypothetical protein